MTALQSIEIKALNFRSPSVIIEQHSNPDGSYNLGISHWTAAVFSINAPDFSLPNNYNQVDIIHDERLWRFKNSTIMFINMPDNSMANYVIIFDKAEMLSNTAI